jgi:Rab-like protein 5
MQDAHGVILVYNPEAAGQAQEIGDWYEYFVKQKGLSESQCLVFAHHHSSDAASRFRPRK